MTLEGGYVVTITTDWRDEVQKRLDDYKREMEQSRKEREQAIKQACPLCRKGSE